MTHVAVEPGILRWARERARMEQDELAAAAGFKKLPEWEDGKTQPTLKQLEDFAKAVHVPIGYLFLPEPPEEPLPIPDFRTFAGRAVVRPSPNLLEMIYACQERQSWFHDFVQLHQEPKPDFVGSASLDTPPETVAKRRECGDWAKALRIFLSLSWINQPRRGMSRRGLPTDFSKLSSIDRC